MSTWSTSVLSFRLVSTSISCSWRHVITGSRSLKATCSRGGILADDMGLGKSLTTIALVAGSLVRAEQYAKSYEESDEKETPTRTLRRRRCAGTLIVAPSSRTLLLSALSLATCRLMGQLRQCSSIVGLIRFTRKFGKVRLCPYS